MSIKGNDNIIQRNCRTIQENDRSIKVNDRTMFIQGNDKNIRGTDRNIQENDRTIQVNNRNMCIQGNDNEILAENSVNNTDLDTLFSNIINNNNNNINIPNSKSTSLEKVNNFMSNRIFTITNENNNKIIYNQIMPIQTREDRKLTN